MLIFCQRPAVENRPVSSSNPTSSAKTGELRRRKKRYSICLGYGHTRATCGRTTIVRSGASRAKSTDLGPTSSVSARIADNQPQLDDASVSGPEISSDESSNDEDTDGEDIAAVQDERIDEVDEINESESENDDSEEEVSQSSVSIEEAPRPKTRSNNQDHVQNIFQPPFTGVGPSEKVPPGIAKDPLVFVQLFLTDEIMGTFVEASNSYARTIKKKFSIKNGGT